jgi:hypothetical protein
MKKTIKNIFAIMTISLLISSCNFGHYHHLNLVRPDKTTPPTVVKKTVPKISIIEASSHGKNIITNESEKFSFIDIHNQIEGNNIKNAEVIEVKNEETQNNFISEKVITNPTKINLKQLKQEIKKQIKENKNKPQNTDSSPLGTIGWVFIILGLVFVLLVSILIGILFMLVGLLFVVAGKQ